ncbi:MAG: hypothetical protein JWQ81_2788 [Amycolatopsis sp.]|uniref:carboxymuconolactone decarboxylase family protein n=1 Tax=Amycolatopsis sp. TaxID=37632 RepID=UPI0026171353|nr:carboxymuconolactone decarboxylase family protein [Amycolatopsis sp.]MCU1682049.1 hypothetical protein [Amycolatopsis sp.]
MSEESNDRLTRGLAKIAEIGGSGDAIFDPLAGIAPDLGRYVAEFAFGDIYSRPGLTAQQRQLTTITALTTLGDTASQLRFHIGVAITVGLAPETVVETILHCLPFAGFPRVFNSIGVAKEVFAKRGLLPVQPPAPDA